MEEPPSCVNADEPVPLLPCNRKFIPHNQTGLELAVWLPGGTGRTGTCTSRHAHANKEENLCADIPHLRKPVLFMIGRGGGGHKASALALRDCLAQRGVQWVDDIELVDVGPIVEQAIHACCMKFCPSGDDIYNWLMKHSMYRMAGGCSHFAKASIGNNRVKIQQAFEDFWLFREPALVVSFVPFLNSIMRASLTDACPGKLLVTVITDMEHSNSHPWIDPWDESAAKHILVVGNAKLEMQADALGYTGQTLRTSGMVVHPAFYAPGEIVLDPNACPRALIFFGGFAPMRTKRIVKSFLASQAGIDLTVICGGNAKLQKKLRHLKHPRLLVEGFIPASRVRDHLKVSAFVLGKPGPGVVSEAAICRIPFVAEAANLMPQEHCALQFIKNMRTGIVLKSLEELPPDLPDQALACKKTLKMHHNDAVFELAEYLQSLLGGHQFVDSRVQVIGARDVLEKV